MKSRRRRIHRPRRPGMKGDWVVGVSQACVETINHSNCDDEERTPTAFSLIDSQDLMDKEDKLTVVRTVGELHATMTQIVTNSDTGPRAFSRIYTFHEGIYVAGADASGPPATVIQLDPSVSADIELDTWMWLRHRSLIISGQVAGSAVSIVAGSFGDGTDAMGHHIDLRVKRKLERGQELIYAANVTVSDVVSLPGNFLTFVEVASLLPQLRLYCKF